MKKDKSIGLRDLIDKVRKELLTETKEQGPAMFSVDKVTLEINFVVTGDLESGFNLGVVSLGSNVSEENTQKVTIELTPLVTKEEIRQSLEQSNGGNSASNTRGGFTIGGNIAGATNIGGTAVITGSDMSDKDSEE